MLEEAICMSKKKNYQCLMVETKDKQQFFTHQKNYNQLMEFSRITGADISVVKVKEAVEVLGLTKLAPAICSTPEPLGKPDFEIIEYKTNQAKKTRPKMLKNAKKIKKFIRDTLIAGRVVKLVDIAKKFQQYKLTLACFCNHLKSVRDDLAKEGKHAVKTGHGEYKIG